MSELFERVSARFPDLAGKSAIVTGASRGIGLAISEFLGRQGMKVTMVSRSADQGAPAMAELQSAGIHCQWVTANLARLEDAQRVLDAAIDAFGAVDVLVNNAAAKGSKPFLQLAPDSYAASFEDNVRIVYGLSRAVARHLVERGAGGAIVHMSSVGGQRAHWGTVGYDASKGAIESLTRAMAIELAPHNIRVNAVAPGWIPPRAVFQRCPDLIRGKSKLIPAGRPGTCEDVAALVAFLASDAATYIVGQVIHIDGGLMAQLAPPGIIV
jgi:3-oxoacyl-[acyl-carrier protein] reductase